MDNLTHSLIGVAIANAGLRKKLGRGATRALVIASNLPDLDVFWGFVNHDPSFAYRRMFTHGLLGIALLSAAGAAVQRRFFPHVRFRTWWLVFLLGMGLHVFFDLLNSYGVVVLYPFSRHRFEISWLFIIDLALWVLLLAPLLFSLARTNWTRIEDLSRVAVRSVIVYVAACGFLHYRSAKTLESYAAEAGMKPSFSYVFPEALGPHRFRGVIRSGNTYHVYRIEALRRAVVDFETVETQDGSPDVARILDTREGRLIAWFAKAPVWKPVDGAPAGAHRWSARDLRFGSTVLHRDFPFTYGFDVYPDRVEFLGRLKKRASAP